MSDPLVPTRDLVCRLADRIEATCPLCGRHLCSITSPQCPHCTARLHVTVNSDHLRLGPWLALLLSAAIPLGFFAGFTVTDLMLIVLGRINAGGEVPMLVACGLSAIVFAALAVWVLRARTALARRSVKRQWLVVLGTAPWLWAWLVVIIVWFDW